MKKQSELVKAYLALYNIGRQPWPGPIARKIFMMRKALKPAFDFQREQEDMLIKKYNGIQKGTSVEFPDKDLAEKYSTERDEVSNMEVDDIDFLPFEIKLTTDVSLSPVDLEALDGFVEFVE